MMDAFIEKNTTIRRIKITLLLEGRRTIFIGHSDAVLILEVGGFWRINNRQFVPFDHPENQV